MGCSRTLNRKVTPMATRRRAGKPAPDVHANLSDIFLTLKKIEARLEFLNERDNLNSFALAVPAARASHPYPRTSVGGATFPSVAPTSPSVLQRIASCEA